MQRRFIVPICSLMSVVCLTACSSRSTETADAALNNQRVPSAEVPVQSIQKPEFDVATDDMEKLPEHIKQGQKMISWRFGVPMPELEDFFAAISKDHNFTKFKISLEWKSEKCIDSLQNNANGRGEFLKCLKKLGLDKFNVRLMHVVMLKKSELLKIPHANLEVHQTEALLQWVEDLIRANLNKAEYLASWYQYNNENMTKSGFKPGTTASEFDYQDGDVVLSLGSNSVSSLIPSSVWPFRRFAHAGIIHVVNGKKFVTEAIVGKGVQARPTSQLANEDLNNLVVLRWSNAKERSKVAAAAANFAYSKVGAPYNNNLSWSDSKKFFTSQLIASSYANAAGIKHPQDLVPDSSKIRSPKLFSYLNQLGVRNDEIASPGDFYLSPHFKLVADFRKSEDLFRAWEMLVWGGVFAGRIEAGFTVKPPTDRSFASATSSTFDEVLKDVGGGFNTVQFDSSSELMLKTQEFGVFRQSIDAVENFAKSEGRELSVLGVSPWELYGWMSFQAATDLKLRTTLIR